LQYDEVTGSHTSLERSSSCGFLLQLPLVRLLSDSSRSWTWYPTWSGGVDIRYRQQHSLHSELWHTPREAARARFCSCALLQAPLRSIFMRREGPRYRQFPALATLGFCGGNITFVSAVSSRPKICVVYWAQVKHRCRSSVSGRSFWKAKTITR